VAFGEDALAVFLQDDVEDQADDEHAHVRNADSKFTGQAEGLDDHFGHGPERPNDQGTQQDTAIIAAAADNHHHPDQECGEQRLGSFKADELEIVGTERTAQTHDG